MKPPTGVPLGGDLSLAVLALDVVAVVALCQS